MYTPYIGVFNPHPLSVALLDAGDELELAGSAVVVNSDSSFSLITSEISTRQVVLSVLEFLHQWVCCNCHIVSWVRRGVRPLLEY